MSNYYVYPARCPYCESPRAILATDEYGEYQCGRKLYPSSATEGTPSCTRMQNMLWVMRQAEDAVGVTTELANQKIRPGLAHLWEVMVGESA